MRISTCRSHVRFIGREQGRAQSLDSQGEVHSALASSIMCMLISTLEVV